MIQTRKDLKFYLQEDFKRNGFTYSYGGGVMCCLLAICGNEKAVVLRYLIALRTCEYYYNRRKSFRIPYIFSKIRLSIRGKRCNIRIPLNAVGYGLRIHHIAGGGGCFLYCKSMGNYCGVNSGVLLGNSKGSDDIPTIGNNVMLNTGVKVFGAIHIGDNCNIGANAVVTKDIPSDSIAVGVPAMVIKTNSKIIEP